MSLADFIADPKNLTAVALRKEVVRLNGLADELDITAHLDGGNPAKNSAARLLRRDAEALRELETNVLAEGSPIKEFAAGQYSRAGSILKTGDVIWQALDNTSFTPCEGSHWKLLAGTPPPPRAAPASAAPTAGDDDDLLTPQEACDRLGELIKGYVDRSFDGAYERIKTLEARLAELETKPVKTLEYQGLC